MIKNVLSRMPSAGYGAEGENLGIVKLDISIPQLVNSARSRYFAKLSFSQRDCCPSTGLLLSVLALTMWPRAWYQILYLVTVQFWTLHTTHISLEWVTDLSSHAYGRKRMMMLEMLGPIIEFIPIHTDSKCSGDSKP